MKRTVNPASVDLKRVKRIGDSIRELIAELIPIFPERETVLEQLAYAFLVREHVLMFGTFGTGKSDLFSTVMDCIPGGVAFRIGLTKFMPESALFGIADPKILREEGRFEYKPELGILGADFAELDEIFDSNPPLLRTLLGILNERQWKRGHIVTNAKLHTAVASTNGDPAEVVSRTPELAALVDRFLFRCKVQYLQKDESRRQMYQKYLTGAKPSVQVTLEDLKYISEIAVGANQITDPHFVEVYDRILQAYRKQVGNDDVISDRRACKLLQLIEASALLYGRYHVVYDDIYAVKHALCHGDEQKVAILVKLAEPQIEEAKAASKQNVDELQLRLLSEYGGKLTTIPKSGLDDAALVALKREMNALKKKVEGVKPEMGSTDDRKKALIRKVDAKIEQVQKLIDAVPKTTQP